MSIVVTAFDDHSKRLGERVADARRAMGLSQKALAEGLGLSLWTIDELESGRTDVTDYLDTIAGATARPVEWFDVPIPEGATSAT